jgi:hypothetical protein
MNNETSLEKSLEQRISTTFRDIVKNAKRDFIAHFMSLAAELPAESHQWSFIYVYNGVPGHKTKSSSGARNAWSAEEARPHPGYQSWLPLADARYNDWLCAQVASGPLTVLTELADLLFSEQQVASALFWPQMLGRTRVLSGQRDRRTALQAIRDVLLYRLLAKDIAFKLSRTPFEKKKSLALLLKSALSLADKASVWEPRTEVLPLLLEHVVSREQNSNVCCLAGSWLTPVLAALGDVRVMERLESMLVVDVLRDEYMVALPILASLAPFRIDAQLDSGSEGDAWVTAQQTERYDLILWNPPYWTLEMYDLEARDHENNQQIPNRQNASQSTANCARESFAEWLQRFVRRSGRNVARLLAPNNGKLVLVVPSEFCIQESYLRAPSWVNTEGLLVKKACTVERFSERFVEAMLQGARDVGVVLNEVARQGTGASNSRASRTSWTLTFVSSKTADVAVSTSTKRAHSTAFEES